MSNTTVTSALEKGFRAAVPAKTTSSIRSVRSSLVNWEPSTQATASTMLDLPVPLGPTTTETPGSNSNRVGSANDLKPVNFSDLRYKSHPCHSAGAQDSRG